MAVQELPPSATISPALNALTDDVLACTHGWVTAARGGQELLSRVHKGLSAGVRQQHIGLWERRKAADKLITKQQTNPNETNKGFGHVSEQMRAEYKAGPSFAHELANDPTGVGFAFGGVDPGTLHAHGQVVKVHTVRYSVGLAGRYRLHVGLRQQAVAFPGSPFSLHVAPGQVSTYLLTYLPTCLLTD